MIPIRGASGKESYLVIRFSGKACLTVWTNYPQLQPIPGSFMGLLLGLSFLRPETLPRSHQDLAQKILPPIVLMRHGVFGRVSNPSRTIL